MSKKDKGTDDAQEFSGMPAPTAVTAADIQQKEFRVSRFGGYRMRDVDEFLDRITESMTKLSEENQRLRSAGGLPVAPAVLPMGAADLADTSRQADEIIQRARVEAAEILRDARAQAAAGGGSSTDAGRAAVAAFLGQEKEFLQQLASLVQGHAEAVKGMAKASRASSKAVAAAPAAGPPSQPARSTVAAPATNVEPAPAPPTATRSAPEQTKAPEARARVADPRPTEPIRVQEPATASVAAGDADDENGGEGDPTLRELFWGEE